jgi:hypothetical protein
LILLIILLPVASYTKHLILILIFVACRLSPPEWEYCLVEIILLALQSYQNQWGENTPWVQRYFRRT